MKNKTIETEIWEEHPEKPGYVRFVKTRKVSEVFKELVQRMEENGMMPDEYFLLSSKFDEKSDMPRDAYFFAYAQWGGNEGVYLEVEMMSENEKQHFATGKTLGETESDYDRMQAIAGFIYKSFAGFGRCPKAEEREEKTYVVCIDESYLRDTQYFNAEDLSDEEFEESGNGLDTENCWCDVGLNAFVDIVSAGSNEDACEIAAEKWGYDKRTMFATEVRKNK